MARNKGKRFEGQYVPMPYALLKSPAWRSLSGAAIKVYFELHTRFNDGNNGKVFLPMNEAASSLGLGKATVQRAFEELRAKGFIALETEGNWYHRPHTSLDGLTPREYHQRSEEDQTLKRANL